jgi:hypothetical protein
VSNTDASKQASAEQTESLKPKTGTEAEGAINPFQQVGVAIIQASGHCRDGIKQWIVVPGETKRQQAEIGIFVDFLCFFTHMTVRRAFGYISEMQLRLLQGYLGEALTNAAIESHYRDWPTDHKNKMAEEFIDRLNESEREYSALDEKGEILEVLMVLTRHTLETLGLEEVDEAKAEAVLKIVVDELVAIDMDKLIGDLKQIEG